MPINALTIHAVPDGSGDITALCGQNLGTYDHTGLFALSVLVAHEEGRQVCSKCLEMVQ